MSLPHTERIYLELPAAYKYLKLLSGCIEELLTSVAGIADREVVTYNVQLAAHEVCTNIVEHAYAGNPDGCIAITLTLHPDPPQMTMDFRDTGRTFDLACVPTPNLDEVRERGYGLFLIYNLMDTVEYTPHAEGNHWHLVKYL
ncbi:MAG: ATP-binding protein [Chloroflexaceae bacterium]